MINFTVTVQIPALDRWLDRQEADEAAILKPISDQITAIGQQLAAINVLPPPQNPPKGKS